MGMHTSKPMARAHQNQSYLSCRLIIDDHSSERLRNVHNWTFMLKVRTWGCTGASCRHYWTYTCIPLHAYAGPARKRSVTSATGVGSAASVWLSSSPGQNVAIFWSHLFNPVRVGVLSFSASMSSWINFFVGGLVSGFSFGDVYSEAGNDIVLYVPVHSKSLQLENWRVR